MFQLGTKVRLARSLLTKDRPIYVQYYVTARCNLACEQCNVIYANADLREATTDEARAVARNLARIGVSVVLLTGGEPFARRDLPEIVRAMARNGIHVRLQTNGLVPREELAACVVAGANDISISLDSLDAATQDEINGGVKGSWEKAIRAIAMVNDLFPEDAFAALGCVIAPRNLSHIPDVIRFATEIGWWVSLVPAHATSADTPLSFRTFDPALRIPPERHGEADRVLDEVLAMRSRGLNVYDSPQYLADIRRFVRGEAVRWRDRNGGVCDSPNLYFAVLPDASMAVCCDWRMRSQISVAADDFPDRFVAAATREEAHEIAAACPGCLFGSFPEITISSRYLGPMVERAVFFNRPDRRRRLVKLSEDEMLVLARRLSSVERANAAEPVLAGSAG